MASSKETPIHAVHPLSTSVAIIGAGCAGLAAACRLAEQGIAVTVFEAGQQPGGRARGVVWQDQQLDNGQHILLGAYHETLALLMLAGVDETKALMRLPLQWCMHGQFSLSTTPLLPAPLHLLTALLCAQGLAFSERWAAIRFMARLRITGFKLKQDEPLQALLAQQQQSARLVKLLWEPLCLAALNTPIISASSQVFLNVLRDSFAKSRTDSDMLLPHCDLSALLGDPLSAYIKHNGGVMHVNTAVTRIQKKQAGFNLITGDDSAHHYSHVIVTVSPFRLADLLAELPAMQHTVSLVNQMQYQPIYTVYLQYAETRRLPHVMMGFAGGYCQWVFDRGQLCGQHGLLAAIISAEGKHQRLGQAALADAIAHELATHFPDFGMPLWHKVIAEKRATFACTAGLQRPQQKSAVPGLYLAGDYISSGDTIDDYPATIEAAVRSGTKAARYVLHEIADVN